MKRLYITLVSALMLTALSMAKNAYPRLLQRQMPDGSVVEYKQNGDEIFHYMTLADGTLIAEGADGYFYYAAATDAGIVATTTRVGDGVAPRMQKTTSQKVASTLTAIRSDRVAKRAQMPQRMAAEVNTDANQHGLVIMVQFTDVKYKYPKSDFENMLNQEGFSDYGSTGSARDYFKDSSYGKYVPTFDIYGPYTLANNCAYYGSNDSEGEDLRPVDMIIEACKLAEADGIDLSKYDYDGDGVLDNVFVFYAGEGEANGGSESTIWPHRWNVYPGSNCSYSESEIVVSGVKINDYACGNEICTEYTTWLGNDFEGLGTFAHEFGHVLGLPDLYDVYGGGNVTPDIYDIMDHGDYCNYGRTMPSYSAYERWFQGWLTPQQIYPSLEGTEYTLPIIEEGKAYLLTTNRVEHNLDGVSPNPTTFYILEVKSGKGWDTYLDFSGGTNGCFNQPGDKGMLITKVQYSDYKWQYNIVNAGTQGLTYLYNISQYRGFFYPMFPGKTNATKISFGNYTLQNVVRDDATGAVSFTISDRTAPAGAVESLTADEPKAVAGVGSVSFIGADHTYIYNAQGAMVYSGTDATITLPAGMYIVDMTAAGRSHICKVVVK